MRAKVINAMIQSKPVSHEFLRRLDFVYWDGTHTPRGKEYVAKLLAVDPGPIAVKIRCPICCDMKRIRVNPMGLIGEEKIVDCYHCEGKGLVWGTKTLEEMI